MKKFFPLILLWLFLFNCQRELKKPVNLRENFPEVPEIMLRNQLSKNPGDYKLWSALGDFFYQEKKLTEAESCFLKALSLSPHHIPALMGLGDVRTARRKFLLAYLAYQKALRLCPDKTKIKMSLALSFFDQRRFKRALWEYKKLLRKNSGNPRIHTRLGGVYLGKSRNCQKHD